MLRCLETGRLCCYGLVGGTKEGLGALDFDRFTSLLWSLLAFCLAFAFMTFRALSRKPAEKMNFCSTGGNWSPMSLDGSITLYSSLARLLPLPS